MDLDKAGKRAETDESLRAERARTDTELARRRSKVEDDTNAAVNAARERSDSALSAARQREDQSRMGRAAANVLAAEREREDSAIALERQRGAAALDAERLKGRIALATLLAAERQETDSRLLLERANADVLLERRDELLAVVSHDLHSLLAAIAIGATMIETELQGASVPVSRHSALMKRAIAQMNRLVSDLVEVASFDAGKLILQCGHYDAAELVQRVAETFESMSSTKELAIRTNVPNQPLPGLFDPDRISRVLANLIGNAIKFTAAGGQISVSVEPAGTSLRFAVADNGEGIAPEKVEGIFERYSQGGRSPGGGLGLGLYIARRIVEAHGGRIWAESTVGEGSTFFFSLPSEQ
jgi:signal transduction histidine kinase